MDVIIYKMNDGSAGIRAVKRMADNGSLEYADENIRGLVASGADESIIIQALLVLAARNPQKSVDGTPAVSWRLANFTDLPSGTPEGNYDTYFRSALVDNNDEVSVDLSKARTLHMNNLRELRAAKFIQLGFPYRLDADLEAEIIPQETRDKLQALRNMPQDTDLSIATTPEELKAIIPTILK